MITLRSEKTRPNDRIEINKNMRSIQKQKSMVKRQKEQKTNSKARARELPRKNIKDLLKGAQKTALRKMKTVTRHETIFLGSFAVSSLSILYIYFPPYVIN